MIQVVGGLLIIGISALYLWAYTYKPPYDIFYIVCFSAFLVLGIAQTIIGMCNKDRG